MLRDVADIHERSVRSASRGLRRAARRQPARDERNTQAQHQLQGILVTHDAPPAPRRRRAADRPAGGAMEPEANSPTLDVRRQHLKVRAGRRRMKQRRVRDSDRAAGPWHQHLLWQSRSHAVLLTCRHGVPSVTRLSIRSRPGRPRMALRHTQVIAQCRFKHPGRHSERSIISLVVDAAPTDRLSAFGQRLVHRDKPTAPWMPRITNFPRLRTMGVALSTSTTRHAATRRWRVTRR